MRRLRGSAAQHRDTAFDKRARFIVDGFVGQRPNIEAWISTDNGLAEHCASERAGWPFGPAIVVLTSELAGWTTAIYQANTPDAHERVGTTIESINDTSETVHISDELADQHQRHLRQHRGERER